MNSSILAFSWAKALEAPHLGLEPAIDTSRPFIEPDLLFRPERTTAQMRRRHQDAVPSDSDRQLAGALAHAEAQ